MEVLLQFHVFTFRTPSKQEISIIWRAFNAASKAVVCVCSLVMFFSRVLYIVLCFGVIWWFDLLAGPGDPGQQDLEF